MALIFDPIPPWHWVSTALAALAGMALLARGYVDRWRVLGRRRRTRGAVLALSLTAALLLALASFNPYQQNVSGEETPAHLVVVLDVSDSLLRRDDGWPGLREAFRSRLLNLLGAMPVSSRQKGIATLLSFRNDTVLHDEAIPLNDLTQAVNRLEPGQFASGDGTDLEAGLRRALALTARGGHHQTVLLFSDGNQTRGDGLAGAGRLARQGIAVHVFPFTSADPDLAITDADLPANVASGATTFLRGMIRNGQNRETSADIALGIPAERQLELNAESSIQSSRAFLLPADGWRKLRWPLQFSGHGIQYADLELKGQNTAWVQRRRFFTMVKRPPKVLAVGGDHRWIRHMPAGAAAIDRVRPGQVLADSFYDYDAVVLSAVAATDFTPEILAALAESVRRDGLGLMVFNGAHDNREEDSPTILMSYDRTPIESMLPVSTQPRTSERDPPGRQVVMVLDASGSMAGWRLDKSREIAAYIVGNLLGPRDRLDLITFSTGANHLLEDQLMNDVGKRDALIRLGAIQAGGGTDPTLALAYIAQRNLKNCGLIFLSDGEFDRVTYRPDCRATVFAIGHDNVPSRSPLWDISDPFPVGRTFNPAAITMPYFHGKARKKFFEKGVFTPLSMERFLDRRERVPVPDMPLQGAAVTYVKENGELVAVRPKLTDPILAFARAGLGDVGVLTTAIPPSWPGDPAISRAVAAWIDRVLAFTARDRYHFKIVERGQTIELSVSLVAEDGRLPDIRRLFASLRIPDEPPIDVALRADPLVPGTFHGQISAPRGKTPLRAMLILNETGPEALARPQRIPIILPPAKPLQGTLPAESFSYGIHESLLMAIAAEGGGAYNPPRDLPLPMAAMGARQGLPLWPWFIIAAAFAYLAAIGLKRWDP